MENVNVLVLAVMSSVAIMTTNTVALEMTAGSKDLQNATIGLDARLNASSAILQTAINQIFTCNNKGKMFASDTTKPGRDADGCVSLPLPPSVSLELQDVVVPAGISRSELGPFVHTLTLPSSIKPWGGLTMQMRAYNGAYPSGVNITYTIPDTAANKANEVIHAAGSDGCKSPGSASYYLYAAYNAGARTITFTYNRSSTKSAIACRTVGFDINQYQYKKAVLVQDE